MRRAHSSAAWKQVSRLGPDQCGVMSRRPALPAHKQILLLLCLVALSGCRIGAAPTMGQLKAIGLGDRPVVLPAEYIHVVYSSREAGETTILLSDVPAEQLLRGAIDRGQVMHIELLWLPKAGATPMDASATNASIRHILIVDGEVGVYGGAGFAMPADRPGERTMKVTVRDATMKLLESTDGFNDRLSPARLSGTLTATRDPALVRKLHRAISQFVTNAMGERRIVQDGDDGATDHSGSQGQEPLGFGACEMDPLATALSTQLSLQMRRR